MWKNLPFFLQSYTLFYSSLLIFSSILILKNWREYNFLTRAYWRFIFTKTKFAIYVIGSLILIIPVPYLNFHSWDYPIATFQPILSYLSAPWAIGVFNNMLKGKARLDEIFVAFCLMMFTGSWSVEIYLLFRDGFYMPDWVANIPIGICCYIIVGLLWNIEIKNGICKFEFLDDRSLL